MAIPALGASAPSVTLIEGVPTTTSNQVALHFGKAHEDVLRRIRTLTADAPADFNARNFAAVDFTDAKGERRPAYRLTRDGFTLLAMGFTGKKALTFKLAYIDAFNRMEQALRDQQADPERLRLAHALSAEVAKAASTTVFDAVMRGDENWRSGRWVFHLNYRNHERDPSLPSAREMARGEIITSFDELPQRIAQHQDVGVTDAQLADLAAACQQRLARRNEVLQDDLTSYRRALAKAQGAVA